MKRILITALVLACAMGLSAQTFGLGLEGSWVGRSVTSNVPPLGTGTVDDVNINIFAVIPLNKDLELEPYIGIKDHTEKDPNGVSVVIGNTAQTGINLGARLMLNLINEKIVELKVGANLRFNSMGAPPGVTGYSHFDLNLSVPIALDFNVTKNIVVRLSQDIARFHLDSESYTNGTNTVNYNFEFTQVFGPYLGLVFMF